MEMTTAIFSRGRRFVVLTLLTLFALPGSSLMAQDRLFTPFAGKQQALNAEQERKFRTFEQQETSGHIELVRIDDLLPAFRSGTLVINLPHWDEEFIAEQVDEEYHPPDTYLWRGKLLSGKGSVVLVQSPGEVTGVIEFEGGKWYKIEPLGSGLHALIDVDMTRFPSGDDTPPDTDDGERQDTSPQPGAQKTGLSNKTISSNKMIEVLVLYTDDASGAVGNISNTAITAINQTRTAYRNSGITSSQLNIRRIRTINLFNFQESSNSTSTVNSLASNSHAQYLRNTYSADVVVLLTDGDYDYGVLGQVRVIGPSNSNAYAIVEAEYATARFTFAHEIGHLQGGRHQQCSVYNRGGCDPAGGSAHGYGWTVGGGNYNWTIMHQLGRSGNRIQHFSNPSVYYNGIATGASNNNVAQNFRNTASTIANFRTVRPLSVSISGPYLLAAGQQGTWTASVHGGRPSYSYRWSKMRYCDDNALRGIRDVPCEEWGTAGSGSSFSSSFNISHRLRLTVTDGDRISKTVYKEVLVTEYGPPGGGLSASYEQTAGEALQNPSLTALTETYALASNYPNPFNPSTEIRFVLPEASAVSLVVYDMMGREVERLLDKPLEAGYHEARWDATGLPSGVYLYRIEAGSFAQTRHMILFK